MSEQDVKSLNKLVAFLLIAMFLMTCLFLLSEAWVVVNIVKSRPKDSLAPIIGWSLFIGIIGTCLIFDLFSGFFEELWELFGPEKKKMKHKREPKDVLTAEEGAD